MTSTNHNYENFDSTHSYCNNKNDNVFFRPQGTTESRLQGWFFKQRTHTIVHLYCNWPSLKLIRSVFLGWLF